LLPAVDDTLAVTFALTRQRNSRTVIVSVAHRAYSSQFPHLRRTLSSFGRSP
jgi:hypothetical protein